MRSRQSALACALLTIGSVSLPACLPSERVAEPPAIVVRESTQDFGHVDQGTPVTGRFTVRNAGGLDLSLDTLRAPCDCTAVASARTIAPGHEAAIDIRCETLRTFGDVSRAVTVYSNDPRRPVTVLLLVGTVALEAAADPPELFLGKVRRGQEALGEVRLLTRSASAPALGPLEPGGRVLAATLVDAPSGKRLRLAVRPDAPLGRFEERITVRTASPRITAVEIPVTGTVVGDLAVSPAALHFGTVSGDASPSRVVALQNRGKAPMRITGVSMSPPLGTAQVQTVRAGQEYRVVVALNANVPAGRLQGELQVRTDHPDEPVVVVPFTGRVVKR